MKASELRIGNLVTIDNKKSWSDLKGKTMTVIGMSQIVEQKKSEYFPNSKNTVTVEGENRNQYNQFEEFIQPITLTEEWLLKFGFVKYDMSYVDEIFVINLWSNGLLMPQYQDRHGKRNPIKYVHQLQNLYFALTGQELTTQHQANAA